MALGDLVVRMSADIAQFQSDMGRAAHIANRTGRDISAALGRAQAVFASLGAGVSLAGLVAYTKGIVDAQDKLGDLAKSTAIAASQLAALAYAGTTAGASMEGLAKGIGSLNLKVAEALSGNREMQELFKNLGLSMEDLRRLSPDELFLRLADRFKEAGESATTSAYAQKVFGKSYAELLPFLDEGADKIRKNAEYHKQYSGITEESIKKSDAFNDELKKLSLLTGAFGRSIVNELLDPMKQFTEKLVEVKEKGDAAKETASGLLFVFTKLAQVSIVAGGAAEALGVISAATQAKLGALARGDRKLWEAVNDDALATLKRINDERSKAFRDMGNLATASEARRSGSAAGGYGDTSGAGFDFGAALGRRRNPLPNLPDVAGAKSAADSLQRLLNERGKNALELLKDQGAQRQALLEAAYSDGLVAERDYWNERYRIQKSAFDAEMALLDAEIARQSAARDKNKPGSADYNAAQKTVEETQARRARLEGEFYKNAELDSLGADRAARAYLRSLEELNIQLLELQGNTAEAARRRFELSTDDTRRRLEANGNTGGLGTLAAIGQATGATAAFNQAREEQALVVARLAIQEERLQNALRTGAITEIEAMQKTGEARKSAAANLEGYVQNLERLAAENPALKNLALQAEAARAALEKLRGESDLLAQHFDTIFKDSFADAFSDFISGTKTAREAFDSFANSVLRAINRMVAEALAAQIAQKLGLTGSGEGGGSVIGGIFSGLFGGGGAAAGAAAGAADWSWAQNFWSSGINNAAGASFGVFDKGTDYVPRDMLALIHRGEAVIPADENRAGRGMTIEQTIVIPPTYDAATRSQVQRDVFESTQLAYGRFA